MLPGDADGAGALRDAYDEPAAVAAAWRARGGKVVGILGHDVPRELVVAAGMLPVRLAPRRLCPAADPEPPPAPAALASELGPDVALVLGALLDDRLDWIDGLVIGRDSESHARLFAVLRELARHGAHVGPRQLAMCDLLRLPNRTSARYNRLRVHELADTLGRWSGRTVRADTLAGAVGDANATAASMRMLSTRRRAVASSLSGSDILVACGAAQVLPGGAARAAVAALAARSQVAPACSTPRARVFLTGSPLDDTRIYEALEEYGLAVVGEDHDWGEGAFQTIASTPDPTDGIVDRYHLSPGGAARSGLRERCERVARLCAETGASGVLQVVFDHDEASGWELPLLRELLSPRAIPVVQARIAYARDDLGPLLDAAAALAHAPEEARSATGAARRRAAHD